jgi:hypothetical protein
MIVYKKTDKRGIEASKGEEEESAGANWKLDKTRGSGQSEAKN